MKLPIATDAGEFTAYYSSRGLARLDFPGDRREADPQLDDGEPSTAMKAWHKLTTAAVKAVLAGAPAGELPPLDLAGGTEFQRRVWNELRGIRPGRTRSYAEIAASIGKPGAARAVGGACGANPVPVLIPCHRVLAANHGLGGFSGGLHWKRTLLAREGVMVSGASAA